MVVKLGSTSIQVKVEIFIEEMYSRKRDKAIEGIFTFVAVGDDKKPSKII
jgi:acyl-CoA hydrolase